jgi:hypothetical protein
MMNRMFGRPFAGASAALAILRGDRREATQNIATWSRRDGDMLARSL